MSTGTTPRPSELIRKGVRLFPDAGFCYTGVAEYDHSYWSGKTTVRRISALGAMFAGAGYDITGNFDQSAATNTLFDGYRAYVSGLGRELPLAEAIEDLMRHEKWTPEDVAVYLERNLGL